MFNKKVKKIIILLMISFNSLYSTDNTNFIPKDIIGIIVGFLPGDNKFLNEFIRLYTVEKKTYNNIAKKLIEKKLIINNDKNISSILDKHFKTSKISDLESKLKNSILELEHNYYPLLIMKQKKYLTHLIAKNKIIKYLDHREELIILYTDICEKIKNNLNTFSKEQGSHYLFSINRIIDLTEDLEELERFHPLLNSAIIQDLNNINYISNVNLGAIGALPIVALVMMIKSSGQNTLTWIAESSIQDKATAILLIGTTLLIKPLIDKICGFSTIKQINNKREKITIETKKLDNKILSLKNIIQKEYPVA